MSDKFDFFLTAHHSASQQTESKCARLKDMSAPILDVFEKLKDPAYFSFGRYHFAYKHEIDEKKAIFEFGLVDPDDPYNCKHLGYGFIRICPNFLKPYTLDIRRWDRVRVFSTADDLLEALAKEYGNLARQYGAGTEASGQTASPRSW